MSAAHRSRHGNDVARRWGSDDKRYSRRLALPKSRSRGSSARDPFTLSVRVGAGTVSSRRTAVRTSARRRRRSLVEGLECRALLASITEYPDPLELGLGEPIVEGPDGNLWFTENDAVSNAIGRITPSGQVTEFKIPTSGSNPFGITVGPDGISGSPRSSATRSAGSRPAVRSPSSRSARPRRVSGRNHDRARRQPLVHRVPQSLDRQDDPVGPGHPVSSGVQLASPVNITAGPNGNLWFTDPGTDSVGQITTSGMVYRVQAPVDHRQPDWNRGRARRQSLGHRRFPGRYRQGVDRGEVLDQYVGSGNFPQPDGITIGPDGNVWFAEQGGETLASSISATAT